jgi:hypothetical protein
VPTFDAQAHTIALADGTPAQVTPLHVLAYWRGRYEEQRCNVAAAIGVVGGTARSLASLQTMLEQTMTGMTAFLDSGVLPTVVTHPPLNEQMAELARAREAGEAELERIRARGAGGDSPAKGNR